ncbi:MFS transporter [Tenacibaculum soleae]|uniref:MFS transporter n=1 Tax=Tenacibaculum soleae TaxID=447689 RepID=UPI002300591A|nr:MFS transporter [Tenacibaculum soleae]
MSKKKVFQLILFILSAEIIYALPYVFIRIFRPTFLHAFDISNTEIGYCYTLYGITALASYFFGGLLADKYQPKFLISSALFLTGLGGVFWVIFPSLIALYILYIYWGITTILLFWSPFIKAMRIWGGNNNQITGFGLLEGGRGIVAAIIGAFGIFIFSYAIPDTDLSKEQLQVVLKKIYLIISILSILLAGLFLLLPSYNDDEKNKIITTKSYEYNVLESFKYPVIWILMLIILSAYTGFRIGDIFTQYASDIYGCNEKESATLGVILAYLRPVICLLVVFFTKNINPTKWLVIGFTIMTIGSLFLALNLNVSMTYTASLIFLISTLTGAYIIRVVYFTFLEEANMPLTITGTAIGLISIIGFLPDIFIGPLIGYYLDEIGGKVGYQYLFIFLLANSIIGLLASIFLNKSIKR